MARRDAPDGWPARVRQARSPYTVEAFALGQPPLQLTTKFSILARQRRCRPLSISKLDKQRIQSLLQRRVLYGPRSGWASATSCARLYTIRLLLINSPRQRGCAGGHPHGVTSRSYQKTSARWINASSDPTSSATSRLSLADPSPLFRLPAMVQPGIAARPHAAGREEDQRRDNRLGRRLA